MRLRRARLRRRRLPRLTARGPAEFVTNPTDRRDELDVRALPYGARYKIIFTKLDYLQPGESLVIMNDHDPKPLRYQTEAMWPDRFTWSYLQSGPEVWRETFGALAPDTDYVLVNDHDPKPLYYQLSAENPGEFSWDYLEQGPDVWRVPIGRVAAASPGAAR